MPKFRKKPVVIEAMQLADLRGDPDAFAPVLVWLGVGGPWEIADRENDQLGIDIRTLEGVMQANTGDWIIRGVKGELYPCRPDIFAATYEPAGD